jgi:amino acid permease
LFYFGYKIFAKSKMVPLDEIDFERTRYETTKRNPKEQL